MRNNWIVCASLVTLIFLTSAASAQPPLPKVPGIGPGKVKIETIQTYSGARLMRPTGIVVYDFAVTPEDVELNRSILNRVRMQAAQIPLDDERIRVSRDVAAAFALALVKYLGKTGLPVSRAIAGQPPPENMLAVQGYFQQIDEGDKLIRIGIGFGAGASSVQAHVEFFLSQPSGNIVISEFEAKAESGKKPGAALSMGAGAMPAVAASVAGAGDKKETANADAQRLAKELSKYMAEAMASQGWIH